MGNIELTERQKEIIEKVKEAAEQIGGTPTLAMLDENPEWPSLGVIRYHFRNYTELLELAELSAPKCTKRYSTQKLRKALREYTLELGRAPTQAEVHNDPRLPSDETILNVYPSWEDALMAAGFTVNWCSPEMREKLLLDLQRKYLELGRKPPGAQDIQNDPRMEKVCVYVQVFGDLDCARRIAGVQKDYFARQRREIVETLQQLQAELGRIPKVRDAGMPNDKLIRKVFGSYENALAAAGMKPNRRYYDRKQLIAQLRTKAKELGRSPRVQELTADPRMASIQTFRKVFGSYTAALEAAKLPPVPAGKGHCYTRDELITQLQAKYTSAGEVPTTADANSDPGMASANVFVRMFGSFKLALEAAGISTRRARAKYTRAQLIEQLQRKGAGLGRAPKQAEIEADKSMASANTFTNEFGGLEKALEAAGFKLGRRREYSDEELLEDLKRKYIAVGFLQTGKHPTNREINADPEMASTRAYDAHFGTTNQARKLVEQMLREEGSSL